MKLPEVRLPIVLARLTSLSVISTITLFICRILGNETKMLARTIIGVGLDTVVKRVRAKSLNRWDDLSNATTLSILLMISPSANSRIPIHGSAIFLELETLPFR